MNQVPKQSRTKKANSASAVRTKRMVVVHNYAHINRKGFQSLKASRVKSRINRIKNKEEQAGSPGSGSWRVELLDNTLPEYNGTSGIGGKPNGLPLCAENNVYAGTPVSVPLCSADDTGEVVFNRVNNRASRQMTRGNDIQQRSQPVSHSVFQDSMANEDWKRALRESIAALTRP